MSLTQCGRQEHNQDPHPTPQSPSYQSWSACSTAESRSTVLARSTCQRWYGWQFMQLQDSGPAHRLFHPPAPSLTAIVRRSTPIGGAIWGCRSANHGTTILHASSGPAHHHQAHRGRLSTSKPSHRSGACHFSPGSQLHHTFWALAPPTQHQVHACSDRCLGLSSAQPISTGRAVTVLQHTAHHQDWEFRSAPRDPPPGEAVSILPQCFSVRARECLGAAANQVGPQLSTGIMLAFLVLFWMFPRGLPRYQRPPHIKLLSRTLFLGKIISDCVARPQEPHTGTGILCSGSLAPPC
ncbi:hypothetical protein NDU88_008103 [Pleurodeles waltl]|uniref:Uncharacterized protein n=1 Tax=Pleurodeles waltl TaxID=8319 RepID=A0AAV7QRL6_PLEWA|nr:hypothetical protein NDU88_008103 [Pleurodeles waltl]